jgi:hypothetical protein
MSISPTSAKLLKVPGGRNLAEKPLLYIGEIDIKLGKSSEFDLFELFH